jgi:hypothetical protein
MEPKLQLQKKMKIQNCEQQAKPLIRMGENEERERERKMLIAVFAGLTKGLFGFQPQFAKPNFGSHKLFGLCLVFATLVVLPHFINYMAHLSYS